MKKILFLATFLIALMYVAETRADSQVSSPDIDSQGVVELELN